jgi:hypothetical protein
MAPLAKKNEEEGKRLSQALLLAFLVDINLTRDRHSMPWKVVAWPCHHLHKETFQPVVGYRATI